MPDFPSPQRIIQELADTKPWIESTGQYPRRGEVQAAEYIIDLARSWSLGEVKRHFIPKAARRFDPFLHQESELSNITIDVGQGNDDVLFLHGHYDVINPADYKGKHGISQSADAPHVYEGLGSYDMLSGIAGILTALHKMNVSSRRRVRAILVFGEENQSEGTHAAFDSHNNLFETGGRPACAISTEITVNASIKDDYHLVVGRPGRVALHAQIFGEALHAGAVTDDNLHTLASDRGARAMLHLPRVKKFRPHPHDVLGLMSRGRYTFNDYGSNRINSLSEPGKFEQLLNIHYAHPEEGIAYARLLTHTELRELLGDEHFDISVPSRHVPWTEPWMENLSDPNYAFAPRIRRFGQRITGQDIPYRAGSGVADENVIASHNIPVVCIPARGEGEHTMSERVDINSITDYMVPVIREAAAYDGILTEK